jgi:guanylate kinase
MTENLKGKLVLIVGPSGSGKGTIIKHLRERHPDWVYPVSYTTRQIRPGEEDGLVYNFISEDEFKKGIDEERFLEYAIVHEKGYYGTDKSEILGALEEGKVVVREVDIQGFNSIREAVDAGSLLTIFVEAGDLEELEKRIADRGKLPEEEVARRMESARKEIAQADECDFRVKNEYGEIERSVEEVDELILKELEK